jgi:hypothetical protein
MAPAQVIDANYKEFLRIDRFARADHIVPPTATLRTLIIKTGNMMVTRKSMANKDRVGSGGIEFAIGFIHQLVTIEHSAAFQMQGRVETRALGRYYANGIEILH